MGYVTNSEMETIYNEVATAFSSESVQDLSAQIESIRLDIQNLIFFLEGAKAKKDRQNLTTAMKEAYQKIMTIRNILLGSQETINYRLYLRSNDLNEVRVYDLSEEEMMTLVERSSDNLRLKRSFQEIDNSKINTDAQIKFERHFNDIERGIEHAKRSRNNFIVSDNVIEDYGYRKNYIWMNDPGPVGKSYSSRKLFNRGWIYQAFDATTFDLYGQINEAHQMVDNNEFRKKYFTVHLDYDNVTGFKGGDVGLNQIKSNMASLMSITTLINYLNIINTILNPASFLNTESLKAYIRSNFLSDNSISTITDKEIEKRATQLYKLLKI